ncbi:autotransporter strand-loop-strand O-heptosyltransferase [Burkholderia sp. Ac-20365]|uniref:autotransporter strand-loop-strand O-heptosyltransferase n=1 Tax=Burkholderia sp. Ac-20365 TaxID=2703897 RepID=UPI00197C604C|nr:autotransporter strand-loop-strand O-heptosyltransferase [Burkholderia sp. Ac-20365]MBN3761288.1 autotransporter strand-loop-strand O-heptosyltransferase [Burkholderia sp. Ac-20365]
MNAPQLKAVQNADAIDIDTVVSIDVARAKDAMSAAPAPSAAAPVKGAFDFVAPAPVPTQEANWGVRYDFNDGCRVTVPQGGQWKVTLRDVEADVTVYEVPITAAAGPVAVSSVKKYFIPFEIEVANENTGEVFRHTMDLKGRNVMVEFPVGTLGDTVGWFPYAVKFARKHQCKLTVVMAKPIIPLFKPMYPEIDFREPAEVNTQDFYATYRVGLFFTDEERNHQPSDFRMVGLHKTAAYILDVDTEEERPLLHIEDDSRPIAERYVVIATQASTQCKYWNNPDGWREVIKYLKSAGYRVICIDQRAAGGQIVFNQIPHGCEDETGNRPLSERARWIKHADFFIGLSSGLSWLAWATGVPVVLISGFTHPTNEFETKFRITNYHACNSCWNDPKVLFDHHDYNWCPRKKGTNQQFECTRLITPEQVKRAIRSIPGFPDQTAPAAPQ